MYYGGGDCGDDYFVGSYFDEIEDVDVEANRAAVERGAARARERREARRRRLGFLPRVCWADGAADTSSEAQQQRPSSRRRCECMCCNGCGKNNGGCRDFGEHWCTECEEWRCAKCMPPAAAATCDDAAPCRYCLRML